MCTNPRCNICCLFSNYDSQLIPIYKSPNSLHNAFHVYARHFCYLTFKGTMCIQFGTQGTWIVAKLCLKQAQLCILQFFSHHLVFCFIDTFIPGSRNIGISKQTATITLAIVFFRFSEPTIPPLLGNYEVGSARGDIGRLPRRKLFSSGSGVCLRSFHRLRSKLLKYTVSRDCDALPPLAF